MLYITGDTHGDMKRWTEQIAVCLSPGDIIIVCGDFGVGFWGGDHRTAEIFCDYIARQEYTVAFIDGNHEDFGILDNCPVSCRWGGRVHALRRNLIHLIRGEVYHIEDNRIFAFGGGYSLDAFRRTEGVSWWPREMPAEEEYRNGITGLENACWQVDYIITHTAPTETVYYLSTLRSLGIRSCVAEELPLTAYLDGIQHKARYGHWYFGHFHVDAKIWRNQTAIFNTVRELTTGKIVRQWEPYEG